jgi:predicted aldo/keto reductase-like oxidoreductase
MVQYHLRNFFTFTVHYKILHLNMSKHFTRKEFIVKTLTGAAAIGLAQTQVMGSDQNVVLKRNMGNTGITVSPICLGAPRTNDEALIKYSIEKGINFIDTGRSYGNGNNERLVGRAVSGIRKDVVIQSKIRLEISELPSKGKGKKGSEEIRNALSSKLEASLNAINSDYFDILLYHDAMDEKLVFHPETMKFFDDMKKSGKIKAHGFSTHNDHMDLLSRNNIEGFYDIIMVPFNHKGSFTHSVSGSYAEWDQNRLISLLSDAGEKGKGIVAMKTCSGGTYSPSADIAPDFKEAVKWVLKHNFVSAAAVAISSFEQVNQHLPLLGE